MLEDLGRFRSPLGTVRLNGDTKLVVSPWAAIGTDALLIGTGLTTFLVAKPTPLKVLGAAGTIWGTVALILETVKLIEDRSMDSQVEIRRQAV